MVVMLLQQHIPPLASQTPCPSHPPLGSSEKAVQLVVPPGAAAAATATPAAAAAAPVRTRPAAAAAASAPAASAAAAAAAAAPAGPGQQQQPPQPPQQPQQPQQQQPQPQPGLVHYDTRAMQYYRLWIYTCNGLLLVCVLGFAVTACHTVVFDQRRNLVPGLSLLQPTFLYGYLAVLSQSGFIQMIGCLGARRLNQKLLNVYWLLLLLLLFGDAMVGVVWLFRFESICEELRPWLRQRLLQEYSADSAFTATWDAYQRDNRCCGVSGPADYTVLNRSLGWLPDSCCRPVALSNQPLPPRSAALRNFHYHGTTTSTPSTTTVGLEVEDEYHIFEPRPEDGRPAVVPDAVELYCGGPLHPPDGAPSLGTSTSSSSVGSGGASSGGYGGGGSLSGVPTGGGRIITHPVRPTPPQPRFYLTGCEVRLKAWLTSAADVLFIVGYCILGFVKVCFLGILRYEIKEMIQKIRMLQGELNAPQLSSPDQEGRKSPPPGGPQAARFSNNNGSLVTGRGQGGGPQDDSPVIGSSRTPQERRGRADSGTTPLLLQPADSLQTTPLHHTPAGGALGGGLSVDSAVPPMQQQLQQQQHPQVQLVQHTPMLHHRHHHHHHHLSLQDGNDSDTNSHCALLINDDAAGGGGGGGGGGGLAGQQARGQSEPKMARQGSNGNNNYELHELHELHDMNRVLLARNRHRTDI